MTLQEECEQPTEAVQTVVQTEAVFTPTLSPTLLLTGKERSRANLRPPWTPAEAMEMAPRGGKASIGKAGARRQSLAALADDAAQVVLTRDMALVRAGKLAEARLQELARGEGEPATDEEIAELQKAADRSYAASERISRLCKGRVPAIVHVQVDDEASARIRAMIAALPAEAIAALAAQATPALPAPEDIIEGEVLSEGPLECQIVQDYGPIDTALPPSEASE